MAKRNAANALQGNLFAEPSDWHHLFLALWPDEVTRQALAERASLAAPVLPVADWIKPEKYHVTLHFFGSSSELRGHQVHAIQGVMDALRLPAFDWQPDRIDSFSGRRPPCVLRGTETPAPLQSLWQQSREGLLRTGVRIDGGHAFVPHVTLAYAERPLAEPLPVPPLQWRVDCVALVHSSSAFKGYRVLARWPLH